MSAPEVNDNNLMRIKTKVVSQPKLNTWQMLYLPELVRGFWITSWHFTRNMFFHVLHAVGLCNDVSAAVTVSYPEEKRATSPRLRTRHRLMQRPDGSTRCVACMMCETICPARCIYIVAEEHPDPNVEKRPASFNIDLGKCVYCGYCAEVCPEDAIRMDTQIQETSAYSREEMMLDMKELLDPRPDYSRKNLGKKGSVAMEPPKAAK